MTTERDKLAALKKDMSQHVDALTGIWNSDDPAVSHDLGFNAGIEAARSHLAGMDAPNDADRQVALDWLDGEFASYQKLLYSEHIETIRAALMQSKSLQGVDAQDDPYLYIFEWDVKPGVVRRALDDNLYNGRHCDRYVPVFRQALQQKAGS